MVASDSIHYDEVRCIRTNRRVPLQIRCSSTQVGYETTPINCLIKTTPINRNELSKPKQLVVTFTGGYIAGVFCALVSHPADTVVSKLNSDSGSTALQAAKQLGWKGIY